jgi:hypothetical protein
MGGVRRLQTQTEAFWRDEYQVSDEEADLIASMILDANRPLRLEEFAATIIQKRFERDREASARQAKLSRLYQPMTTYAVGDQVMFSGADYRMGQVLAVRPGHNPKHGLFEVMQVRFEDGTQREFASAFPYTHPLNRPVEELLGIEDPNTTEAEMVRLYQSHVLRKLEAALTANEDFVSFDGLWLLRELLPEIHVGHLNLAEAMIYEAARPLAIHEMLPDLDLSKETSSEAQAFSFSHELGRDGRFDNIGTAEAPLWYLRALQPEAVHERPTVHRVAFRAQGGEYLGITMLDLIEQIGDELDEVAGATVSEGEILHCELCFAHLYAGTLPATARFLRRFDAAGHHFPITVVDDQSKRRFQAWVVPSERYVCGFSDWYAATGMCIGGQVTLMPAKEAGVFTIMMTATHSRRSEWIRSASVIDDRLVLQMQRTSIPVRCDRNMLIDVPDRQAIARLMSVNDQRNLSLAAVVRTAFEEMAKLSSGGAVHAKSIYSAVNLLRRSGAVPVFAELTRRACYTPLVDGNWALESGQDHSVYRTPADMYERTLSTRGDAIKDQVVQYQSK